MKRLYILFAIIGLISFSCNQGIPGPTGRPGQDGLDGLNGEEGYVFEYEFSFTAPDYSILLNLPDDFVMLDSDVMLVYFLWDVTDDGTEVWRSLPQTLFFTDGMLQYNYDFTKFDANVFLDGTVNLNGLGADLTDNWIARVVVVPAQFSGRIDYSNYEEVKAYFNLSPSILATKNYPTRPKK
ncbi:collagen-like protein [Ekhidna sp.]|uniref:collagen-like triple helix repeat-containing protein n=1 Tax=Ekhidna sp. TaxID=2608089 RepID=UPI0032980F5C